MLYNGFEILCYSRQNKSLEPFHKSTMIHERRVVSFRWIGGKSCPSVPDMFTCYRADLGLEVFGQEGPLQTFNLPTSRLGSVPWGEYGKSIYMSTFELISENLSRLVCGASGWKIHWCNVLTIIIMRVCSCIHKSLQDVMFDIQIHIYTRARNYIKLNQVRVAVPFDPTPRKGPAWSWRAECLSLTPAATSLAIAANTKRGIKRKINKLQTWSPAREIDHVLFPPSLTTGLPLTWSP